MEPLVFAILAGRTPSDVQLTLHDERLARIPDRIEADLIALTVETYTARRAYQIASHHRRRGIPVVVGGYHPTFLPEEALQYASAVALGDAEEYWSRIVEDARAGRLQRIYRGSRQPPLAGLRYDRSIFRGKRYAPVAPVQYSRGCRFACDFCSIHAFYGSRLRHRPVKELVAEIESLGRKSILIVDDNVFVDVTKAKELFRALIPLRIRWGCQITIDVIHDAELMDLLAESGCTAALIGFESLDSDNLEQMKKGWSLKFGDYAAAVRQFHERGILVYGSFIFGYDHEGPDIFERTVEFALESKLFLVNFTPLAPTPGTALYERVRAEGRLMYDCWWLDPNYRYGDALVRPRQMTADQLTEGCIRARQAFYRYSSIARRAFRPRVNARSVSQRIYQLGLFLAANLRTRRELDQKLGHRLGSDEPLEPAGTPHLAPLPERGRQASFVE